MFGPSPDYPIASLFSPTCYNFRPCLFFTLGQSMAGEFEVEAFNFDFKKPLFPGVHLDSDSDGGMAGWTKPQSRQIVPKHRSQQRYGYRTQGPTSDGR